MYYKFVEVCLREGFKKKYWNFPLSVPLQWKKRKKKKNDLLAMKQILYGLTHPSGQDPSREGPSCPTIKKN